MRVVLLHNYRFTEPTNRPNTPYPHFIYLLPERFSINEDRSAFAIPLPEEKPIIFDLGFARYSIVLQLKAMNYLATEAERGTISLTQTAITRVYKEYTYRELLEIFSTMKYTRDDLGYNWEILFVEKSNSISDLTVPSEPRVEAYPVAVSNVATNYEPPSIYSDITANLITSGAESTPYNRLQ